MALNLVLFCFCDDCSVFWADCSFWAPLKCIFFIELVAGTGCQLHCNYIVVNYNVSNFIVGNLGKIFTNCI